MWNIEEPRNFEKTFRALPKQVQEKYQTWKAVVRNSGVDVLKNFTGFNDEPLKGKRKGQRSSRMSRKYRLIYEVERDIITVFVVEIIPHNY